MKSLPSIKPTPEQLPLITDSKPGVMLIRGAAGSGKTTTALLRLRQLVASALNRRARLSRASNVSVLVLTYNRTLKGYVTELAEQQVTARTNVDITIDTFAHWAKYTFTPSFTLDPSTCEDYLRSLIKPGTWSIEFVLGEIDYVLGRFEPDALEEYLDVARVGRGASPRMDRPARQTLLSDIIEPYVKWKRKTSLGDWNDLAILAASSKNLAYDIIIVDEAQDFSANQVRGVQAVSDKSTAVTYVLDAAQRIYPRGFTWKEVGISLSPSKSFRLKSNHRNTVEICRFAAPLLSGLDFGDDGTMPDLASCSRHGPKPLVLVGKYSEQLKYALKYIADNVDLSQQSVAFLKPMGGKWFKTLTDELDKHRLAWVDLSRRTTWPTSGENIGICTMSSAKGLEFDHVMVLGLSDDVTKHGEDPDDDALTNLRRLFAMALTRARMSVIVGYKDGEASTLIDFLQNDTYEEIEL